jgi:hypothetical protein
MPQIYPYPFDETGMLPGNKIINENHSVTVANGINAFVIVPDATPFFGNSLVIVDSSGNTLVEGVNYYLTHHWQQATDHIGLPVYGTITLIEGYPVGSYKINYQTIGGEYVLAPANAILSGLTASASGLLTLDWSTAPTYFPPIPHSLELSSLNGMTQIYRGLSEIADSIKSPLAGLHYDDIAAMPEVNLITTVAPILEIIQTISENSNSVGILITELMKKLNILNNDIVVDHTLDHFSIPLPYGFTLKIGKVLSYPGLEKTYIGFTKPTFKHTCLFCNCTLTFTSSGQAPSTDTLYVGKPSLNGVKVKIVYDPLLPPSAIPGPRLITYLAIGI